MKILFVSNSNPHFRNTNHYRLRALSSMGHQVLFFDVRGWWRHSRLGQVLPWVEAFFVWAMNLDLRRTAARFCPDHCFVIGGFEVQRATLISLRRQGIVCTLWTTDAPDPAYFGPITAAASAYERVLCAGTEAILLLEQAGCSRVQWLPFACDPELHTSVPSAEDYRREVAFVGSYYPNRAVVLSGLTFFRLGIWGPLWDRLPAGSPLKAFARDCRLDYEEWRRIYASADIVLVIHYQDGKIACNQASPKLFEAMACGAFVLCDRQKDAMTLFQDGQHLVFFQDEQDLQQKVRYYLSRPDERRRIAARGRQEVLSRHTYVDRMNLLLGAAAENCP